MTGKLNGVIAATTPTGCFSSCTSTPVETCSLWPPLSSCGTPHANSTHSTPALHLAGGVGQHLAVLGGDQGGELVGVLDEQVVEPEHDLGAAGQRRGAPSRQRGPCGGDGRVDLRRARERDLAGLPTARGVEDRGDPVEAP